MLTLAEFYNPKMWTRLFWAWGAEYTIVPNRHIGLDIGTGRKAIDVPALLGGKVVRVRNTNAMGIVVVIQTGGDYLAYCHLSKHNLPVEGQYVVQGGRVGRLAAGPRTLDSQHVEYPGTAWGGIHLHLVHTNHPEAAYRAPRVRGSEFYDPATLIRQVLSSPASTNATPINPPEEEDMTPEQDARLKRIENFLEVTGQKYGRPQVIQQAVEDIQARLMAPHLTGGNWDAFDETIRNTRALLALSSSGADVDAAELASHLAPLLPPLLSAQPQAISDADLDRIKTAVADEQARRLSNK